MSPRSVLGVEKLNEIEAWLLGVAANATMVAQAANNLGREMAKAAGGVTHNTTGDIDEAESTFTADLAMLQSHAFALSSWAVRAQVSSRKLKRLLAH